MSFLKNFELLKWGGCIESMFTAASGRTTQNMEMFLHTCMSIFKEIELYANWDRKKMGGSGNMWKTHTHMVWDVIFLAIHLRFSISMHQFAWLFTFSVSLWFAKAFCFRVSHLYYTFTQCHEATFKKCGIFLDILKIR